MPNRRDFLKTASSAAAGMMLGGSTFAQSTPQGAAATPGKRREVSIGGRRVKVVDVHAHCVIPEVADIVKDTPLSANGGLRARGPNVMGPERLRAIDDLGIDVQVLSINGYWFYAADRDIAAKVVRLHDEKLAEWCTAHADRYVAHVQESVIPGMQSIDGFRGVQVLKRPRGDRVDFTVITMWTSIDAILRFAGADAEVAVVAPEAQALLTEYDRRAQHYDVVIGT